MNKTEIFIQKSKEKFGDKFDYSRVKYINYKTPVILICPKHGEFSIIPKTHLNSPTGCQECSKYVVRKKKYLIAGQDRKTMREYKIWKGIRTRVNNPNTDDRAFYVEKGIKMCKEWDSFEQFYKDMGKCPDGYSIDRIDNNGDYCPENCRWANAYTQSQNRGEFNDVYTYNNETHVLKEWSRILNIKYTTLRNRIYISNLPFEKAIQKDPFCRQIEYKGEKHTLKEWCNLKNMPYHLVVNRMAKHKWNFGDAIETPKGTRRSKI